MLVLLTGTYTYCVLSWMDWNQGNKQSPKKNNKYQLLYTYVYTS